MRRLKKTAAFLLALVMMLSIAQSGVVSSANGDPVITGNTPAEKVESIVSQMTFTEKFGQMLAFDCRTWNGSNQIVLQPGCKDMTIKYALGGQCLFSANVAGTVTQMVELTDALQHAAVDNSRFHIPLLLSIDQEGGYIVRLDTKGTIMPGNMAVGSTYDPEMAYKTGKVIGEELFSIGCNVDFAPDLDVNSNPDNPVIGLRSFGDNPEMVGLMGAAYTKGMLEAGVIATGKHFPGHGNTGTDSHSSLPMVPGDYDYLMANDLLPFKMAIDAGMDMIMTGHLSLPEFDDTEMTGTRSGAKFSPPATMSKKLLTDTLRGELGFEGLIVTDSMRMGALGTHFYIADSMELAILAGVDLPLMPVVSESDAHVVNNVAPLFAEMEKRANEKPELMARIEESVKRILMYKIEKGIYDPDAGVNQPCFDTPLADRIAHANATMRSEEHLEIEKEVSKASVVLAVNETIDGKPVLPFGLKEGDSVYLIQPTDYVNVTLFKNAVDKYLDKVGLTGKVTVVSQSFSASVGGFTAAQKAEIDKATYVIVSYPIVDKSYRTPTPTGTGGNGYARNVVEVWNYINDKGYGYKTTGISTMLPYDLMFLPNVSALVNCSSRHLNNTIRDQGYLPIYYYGIEAIFGEFSPTGKFPVSVPDPNNPGEYLRRAGDGLTYSSQYKAESIVSQMTFEEKMGQLLIPRSPGATTLSAAHKTALQNNPIGGICLFAGDVAGTITQTVQLTDAMQREAVSSSRFNIPLLLSIDQEGGYIIRTDRKATIMPGNMAVGSTYDPEMAYKAAKVIGEEMASLGVNVDFAPSLDVNSNPANPVIGVRSFGDDPEMVGLMGAAYTRGIHDAGIIAAGKHFPGHGNTATDSHVSLPLVPGDQDYLMQNDLLPFKMAIEAGLDMIMTAHVTVPETDTSYITGTKSPFNSFPTPATLSKKILTDILRGDLGFEGLIVTDALEMAAINNNFGREDAVALCIKAGVDLPLMPGNTAFTDAALSSLIASLKTKANDDPELMARIEESATRVIKYKIDKGIYDPDAGEDQPCFDTPLEDRIANANATLRSEENLAVEAEVSKAAVVLAVNETINGKPVLPFALKEGDSVYLIQTTDYVNVTLLKNAVDQYLAKVGLVGKVSVVSQSFGSGVGAFTAAHKTNIDNATYVIVGYPVVDSNYFTPSPTGTGGGGYARNVVEVWNYIKDKGYGYKTTGISTMLPYDLMFLPYVSALVNCSSRHLNNNIRDQGYLPIYYYGIEAIFGEFAPTGKFPVSVPDPANPGTYLRRAGDGLTYTFAESVQISGLPTEPVAVNSIYPLSATVLPDNTDYKAVTWSVTDEDGNPTSLATITAEGVFKAVADGTVRVTATTKDQAAIEGSVLVTISSPYVRLAAGQPSTVALKVGQTYQLNLETNANALVYVSNNANVTVTQKGVLTGVKAGVSVITVRSLLNPAAFVNIVVNCTK